MWVTALERKLGRELLQLKGQILTIALVVASGIMSFAALRGTYESLEASRSHYYADRRFADVFAFAKRVPSSVARRVEALPGVATVETRVTGEITLPIEGLARPAYGRLLSLPSGREPATNAPHLRRGRWPERSASEEVVVLESFAEAHGLARLGGARRRLSRGSPAGALARGAGASGSGALGVQARGGQRRLRHRERSGPARAHHHRSPR